MRSIVSAAALMLAVAAASPALAQQAYSGPAGLLGSQQAHQAQSHMHTVAQPEALKWVEPATLPGAQLAVVQGDPTKEGLFAYRLRMPANYRIPPHVHKASENVTVLSGVFFMGIGEKFDQGSGQELPVGGFASIPPNHAHFAWVGDQETIVQVHGVGPTDLRFVNPADDPRKK